MIKAIFFDLGGVIILNKVNQIYQEWAQKLNISVDELRSLMRSFNDVRMKGSDISAKDFLKSAKIDFISEDQLLELQNNLWGTEYVNEWLVESFIKKNQSKFTLGVISNNFKEAEEVLLKKFKVPKFYSLFISSPEIGSLKPDRKIYEYALSKGNFKPQECLFIDDSLPNVQGAEEVGMIGLQFTDNDKLKQDLSNILGDSNEA